MDRCFECGRHWSFAAEERKLGRCLTCWLRGMPEEARQAHRLSALAGVEQAQAQTSGIRRLTEAELWHLGWFGVAG